jgi:hypothetical protein
MKTGELTQLLALDTRVLPAPERALLGALLPTLLVVTAFTLWIVGLRPDFVSALTSTRFEFKLVWTALFAAVAVAAVLRLARPGADGKAALYLFSAPAALLAAAVALELLSLPVTDWRTAAMGQNAIWCLRTIPALALLPFVAGMWVLRHSAPGRPALAGAVNGLMAGGLGAALYALHCQDDSPLFVATWYVLAIAAMALLGAVLGRKLLRW